MIAVGERAPDFDLEIVGGGRVQLRDALTRGPLVLFFYPKDATPGCTVEVCSFRDAYADFTDAGAQVIGVSSDSVDSHGRFATKYDLPYPLASDPGGKVRDAYGVPKTLGLLPGRVTFVIDRDGIVRSTFNSQFGADKHVPAALAALRALV
jgi:peroxiredoxin Q/BCP